MAPDRKSYVEFYGCWLGCLCCSKDKDTKVEEDNWGAQLCSLSVKDQTTSNIISLTGGLSTFEGFTLRASCLTCSIKGYPYFLLAYISTSDLQNWTQKKWFPYSKLRQEGNVNLMKWETLRLEQKMYSPEYQEYFFLVTCSWKYGPSSPTYGQVGSMLQPCLIY